MACAWFTPASFSPIPVGRSTQDEVEVAEKEKSEEEGRDEAEDEILRSVEYVCGLVDEEVENGVDVGRIVVGGFSQGCAVSLVLGLGSRYQGKIGGVVGLSGYLPRVKGLRGGGKRVVAVRGEEEVGAERETMRVFLAHGTRDMLVPMRVFRECKETVEKMVGGDLVETHEYEGMGHATCGPEFRDMCAFLESVLSP